MRRLPLFVSVVVAVDTLFFTALTPLIPRFADKYDLSKAGAGALVAAYAAGTLVGAVPGVTAAGAALVGWAARMPGIAPERQPLKAGLAALGERSLVAGLWLISLPALLFGVLVVLVPLELNRHGWGPLAIGSLFVATTA